MKGVKYGEPEELSLIREYPDAFVFRDGKRVKDAGDWAERREEIKALYEYYVYGPLPKEAEESVHWRLREQREDSRTVAMPDGSLSMLAARVMHLEVIVEFGGRRAGFPAVVTLPVDAPRQGRYPVHLEMRFVMPGQELEASENAFYAAGRGYATINYKPVDVAADNSSRSGAFYTLHPYGGNWQQQTGVLAAWGWGASRLLDALEQGLGEKLRIDPVQNILSGVSRYGKAALAAGAYDSRFKVVVPACSGAGGMALYRCCTEGRVYDLGALGYVNEEGGTTHMTGQNEPLSCLQGESERQWFNDRFLRFDCVERLPVDQHLLAALMADSERYLFVIIAAYGEDWVNGGSMYAAYKEAEKVYSFLGLEDHIAIQVHLQGHAILIEDMIKLLDYCDAQMYGVGWEQLRTGPEQLKNCVYDEQ